jgi:transposase IS166 family protein
MHLDLARLPDDAALLQQVVRDLAGVLDRQTAELDDTKARLADRDAEIEKLRLFLAMLRRQRFGRSSEKSHPDQLALSLEAIEEQIAALEAKSDPAPAPSPADPGKKPRAASRSSMTPPTAGGGSAGSSPASKPATRAPMYASACWSGSGRGRSRRRSPRTSRALRTGVVAVGAG